MKSERPGGAPQEVGGWQALTTGFLPWAMTLALLIAAQDLRAQQDNPQVSKPKETIVVTGVYEPVPLGEVDRPITQLDVRSNELVSNSLEDFLRLDCVH